MVSFEEGLQAGDESLAGQRRWSPREPDAAGQRLQRAVELHHLGRAHQGALELLALAADERIWVSLRGQVVEKRAQWERWNELLLLARGDRIPLVVREPPTDALGGSGAAWLLPALDEVARHSRGTRVHTLARAALDRLRGL